MRATNLPPPGISAGVHASRHGDEVRRDDVENTEWEPVNQGAARTSTDRRPPLGIGFDHLQDVCHFGQEFQPETGALCLLPVEGFSKVRLRLGFQQQARPHRPR